MSALAEKLIKSSEGVRLHAYDDATGEDIMPGSYVTGSPTIGWGRNLYGMGISKEEADLLFMNDYQRARCIAVELVEEFGSLDTVRRAVLLSMAHNLGKPGLKSFKRMRHAVPVALRSGDWESVAYEIMDSRAAHQLPERYAQLADMMRTGEVPDELKDVT